MKSIGEFSGKDAVSGSWNMGALSLESITVTRTVPNPYRGIG